MPETLRPMLPVGYGEQEVYFVRMPSGWVFPIGQSMVRGDHMVVVFRGTMYVTISDPPQNRQGRQPRAHPICVHVHTPQVPRWLGHGLPVPLCRQEAHGGDGHPRPVRRSCVLDGRHVGHGVVWFCLTPYRTQTTNNYTHTTRQGAPGLLQHGQPVLCRLHERGTLDRIISSATRVRGAVWRLTEFTDSTRAQNRST